MEERILQAASQLFCQYGIKSITMVDIASHLGISKKTIYQYYKDKKELVYLWMEKMLGDQQSDIEEHEKGAANAIEEILAVIRKHVPVDPEKVKVTAERAAKVSTLSVDIEIPMDLPNARAA